MRALVVGGSGFIGRPLVQAMLTEGWDVSIFALEHNGLPPGACFLPGSRHDPASLQDLSRCGDFDAVIDLVAYRPDETKAMVDLWTGRTGRFIHLSTVSVYRGTPSPAVTEETVLRWEARDGTYGAEKAACERVLEDAFGRASFPHVTLRAAPVMGPADPASRENCFLKRIVRGQPMLYPAEGVENGYVTLLYLPDLVQVILASLARPGIEGRTYHLAQAARVTLREHVERIAALVGLPARILPVPARTLHEWGFALYAFPYGPAPPPAWIDSSRAVRELGFRPTPWGEALAATVAWYRERDPAALPAWPGRGSRQSRLAGSHELLHAELERRFLDGVGRADEPSPSQDELLEHLASGDPEPARLTVRPVPRVVLHRGGSIQGVLEPDPDALEPAGWLYTLDRAARVQSFRYSSAVPRVRFLGFSRFNPAGVPEGERVIAVAEAEADLAGLRNWTAACDLEGSVLLGSLASYSRVFLAAPEGACDSPWAALFTLSRLLRQNQACTGEGSVRLNLSTQRRPVCLGAAGMGDRRWPGVLLAAVGDRYFLADTGRRRVFEISAAAALMTETLWYGPAEAEAMVRQMADRLALPYREAERFCRTGIQSLVRMGLGPESA